jgi:hypothetical protein
MSVQLRAVTADDVEIAFDIRWSMREDGFLENDERRHVKELSHTAAAN